MKAHSSITSARVGRRVGGAAAEGPLLDLGDSLVDGLGYVIDVLRRQPAHVDATASHQVDVLLLDHVFYLFGCKERE